MTKQPPTNSLTPRIMLNKVAQILFTDSPQKDTVGTGLFLELEDGRIFQHSSDDCVVSFEEVSELPKNKND